MRGSLALERAARAWALLSDRHYVVPADVDHLFVPVLVHRIVFRPAFAARARKIGWPAAIDELRDASFALARPPGRDAEGEVISFAPRAV